MYWSRTMDHSLRLMSSQHFPGNGVLSISLPLHTIRSQTGRQKRGQDSKAAVFNVQKEQ